MPPSEFELSASQWPDWLKDEGAMARVVRAFERSELNNVHWSRLTPEYQAVQVALAFWTLTKERGKPQDEALTILTGSAGRLYSPVAVDALRRNCQANTSRSILGNGNQAEKLEAQHSLDRWHAQIEAFEKEHPLLEAFMRLIFVLSTVGIFGWYGIELARYLFHRFGFSTPYLIFLILYGIERAAEILYFQHRRQKGVVYAGWTLSLLTASHVIVMAVAAIECFWSNRPISLSVSMLGYIIFIGGTLLRWWSISTLGPYESAHIEIREPHPVIVTGPYRYLRHPRYFANVLEVLSVPLIGNAWYACGLALLTYVPFTWLRLVREESVMREKLGNVYESYRSRVKLWPSLKPRG